MKLFTVVMTGFLLATLTVYVFASPDKDKKDEKSINEWMPPGSFMPGILLSGLDAPTGGQAQTNPHPVLIRIKDMAVFPNRFRENVKGCFLVGVGYGDLSSKQAYIRAETLSCVLKNGKLMDVKVKGFVTGEEGKKSVGGKLVSKQAAIIDQSLMAGFASGVGKAFQQSSATVSTSPLGTTTTVDPKMVVQVIEIEAGRQINVIFPQGFEIHLDPTDQPEKLAEQEKK